MTNSKSPESTVVDLFFNHGVIKVDASSPFVLSSGAKAPIYLDHRRAFTNALLRKNLVTIWAQKIESQLKNLGLRSRDVVFAGTATAGIAPAMALADHFECEFIYVRQKPKGHGMQQMVEGEFNPRKPHVVIDDMMTTGQSVLKSIEALRQLETRLVMATTVTTHAIPASHRKFEAINLPFVALFETVQILEIAKGMGLISQSDLRTVMAWLEGFSAMNDSID